MKYYKFTQYRRQYLICNFFVTKNILRYKIQFFNIAAVKEDFKYSFDFRRYFIHVDYTIL